MKLFWGKKLPRRTLFAVGAYTITYNVYDWLYAPFTHKLMDRPALNAAERYGAGTFAVVAGASSDTGRAYCQHLQKEGFKLILVDDSPDLEQLAKELEAKYFSFDFKRQTSW